MDYHVFKKTRIKGGKKIYKWYYYYTQDRKRVQKVCKGCSNRSDAESYIRILSPLTASKNRITVNDIAEKMFLDGSNHVLRREQLGLSVSKETLKISRGAYCREALGLPGLSRAHFLGRSKNRVCLLSPKVIGN